MVSSKFRDRDAVGDAAAPDRLYCAGCPTKRKTHLIRFMPGLEQPAMSDAKTLDVLALLLVLGGMAIGLLALRK